MKDKKMLSHLIFHHLKFWKWNKTCYDTVSKGVTELPKDNVYQADTGVKDYVKKQKRIHYKFKYLFIAPLMWIGLKVLGKYKEDSVPDKPQYTNLRIFEKSYIKSMYEWNTLFRVNIERPDKPKPSIKHVLGEICNFYLRTALKFYLTITKNDSAYFEFHNILMLNIAKDMAEYYGTDANHLFYTSKSIKDVKYFICSAGLDGLRLQQVKVKQ